MSYTQSNGKKNELKLRNKQGKPIIWPILESILFLPACSDRHRGRWIAILAFLWLLILPATNLIQKNCGFKKDKIILTTDFSYVFYKKKKKNMNENAIWYRNLLKLHNVCFFRDGTGFRCYFGHNISIRYSWHFESFWKLHLNDEYIYFCFAVAGWLAFDDAVNTWLVINHNTCGNHMWLCALNNFYFCKMHVIFWFRSSRLEHAVIKYFW